MPLSAFKKLSELLLAYVDEATEENLLAELTNFIENCDIIKDSILSMYEIMPYHTICCYLVLIRYNLVNGAYAKIGLAYKYVLSLSFPQVAREKSFSILKFIKIVCRAP